MTSTDKDGFIYNENEFYFLNMVFLNFHTSMCLARFLVQKLYYYKCTTVVNIKKFSFFVYSSSNIFLTLATL